MTVNEYQTYSLLNNSDRSSPNARALRLRLTRGIQGVVAAALAFLRGSIGAQAPLFQTVELLAMGLVNDS